MTTMRLAIYHNILWSRYKASVYSQTHRLAEEQGIDLAIVQIAETDSDRMSLSPVDRSFHRYPFRLLFEGAYSRIPRRRLFATMAREALRSDRDLTLLAGYHAPEFWIQALILKLKGQRYALFCDSTIYDNPQTGLKGIAKRIIFGFASGVLCYGERARAYVLTYGGRADRVFIRCQAAALAEDYTPEAARARRIASAAPREAPRFLYVGRLSPEKSIDTALAAFAQVKARLPAATFVIVGGGPEADRLKATAAELGLAEAVDFAGSRFGDALTAEYARATCLVLPSHSEPWGLVVNEALHHGCPVVVSHRCGCVPELVVDGVTGYAYTWGDAAELADRMVDAVETFADVPAAADRCLDHIAAFNPTASATAILSACRTMLGAPATEGARDVQVG